MLRGLFPELPVAVVVEREEAFPLILSAICRVVFAEQSQWSLSISSLPSSKAIPCIGEFMNATQFARTLRGKMSIPFEPKLLESRNVSRIIQTGSLLKIINNFRIYDLCAFLLLINILLLFFVLFLPHLLFLFP